jgi:DNA-directed RNA polymerase specialized sigma24 family protein
MAPQPDSRFDDASTSWALIEEAHDPAAPAERRQAARHQLLARYEALVRRYLSGALEREPGRADAVAECVQEFSQRVLEGRFQGAGQERGRFRAYLLRSLQNLVNDYRRARARRPGSLGDHEPAVDDPRLGDQGFNKLWAEELVCRALRALADLEQRTGQVLHSVLALKAGHPELSAGELAAQLSGPGQPRTAEWVTGRLYKARLKLAELIRAEVRLSLKEPSDEEVEEELADLGLLAYLDRRKGG